MFPGRSRRILAGLTTPILANGCVPSVVGVPPSRCLSRGHSARRVIPVGSTRFASGSRCATVNGLSVSGVPFASRMVGRRRGCDFGATVALVNGSGCMARRVRRARSTPTRRGGEPCSSLHNSHPTSIHLTRSSTIYDAPHGPNRIHRPRMRFSVSALHVSPRSSLLRQLSRASAVP